MAFVEPIRRMSSLRLNRTLHGRSVHRPGNVSGHNVFKGFNNPGVGDAIDFFCPARQEVFAIGNGVQVSHRNDATRLEVIHIEGDGWLAIYAHIDAAHNGSSRRYDAGEVVGRVRGDLSDPHLHFELWMDGRAVHAPTPGKLRMRMLNRLGLAEHDPIDAEPRLIVAKQEQINDDDTGFRMNGLLYNEIPSRFDHRNDTFLVDTRALAEYLDRNVRGLEAFAPIRQALRSLGINNAEFRTDELDSQTDPRAYVFVP